MLRKKEKEHRQGRNENHSLSLNKFTFVIFLFFALFLSEILVCPFYPANAQENQPASNKDLGNIEEKIFHQKFDGETKEERISRLENFIFGKKNANESLETRINKIFTALESPSKEIEKNNVGLPVLENEKIQEPQLLQKEGYSEKKEPQVIYDEPFNQGILGAISKIENKVFNMTFNNIPFPTRVAALEERLLSRSEIIKNRKKSLLERVTILIQKASIPINELNTPPLYPPPPKSLKNNYQYNQQGQSYTIDPKTGFLINEQTKEVIKDNYGNPILVMLPQPPQYGQIIPQPNSGFLPPQNQFNPYGLNENPFQQSLPGQLPLDLLFKQGGLDTGSEPDY